MSNSRDTLSSISRIISKNGSRNPQTEPNENDFDTSQSSLHFPPPRTPLNTITDPIQLESTQSHKSFNKKLEGSNYVTPRVSGKHHWKAQLEPNPARTGPRISFGGRGRGGIGSSSVSILNSEICTEVPHFELVEDAAFWNDHNVQVLIRIRPLSTMERVSQGFNGCLKQESVQTLVWQGHPETRFTFDHIASETISQEKLFKVAGLPMVENCLSGYNSCMFAYGQTGSGKTYTMMGEIYEVEGKLNEDCGITPRIFEYLFARIRTEEESRRDEKLKFSCKCSFLEIYNEQITDLLEPSSTNLQLREDLKKGVYVENLTEYNVRNVTDVVKLLLQGAANRKMAATNMNSESSRSHSVFTCIIESHWEKELMTHFRFARLNLVDLAGSERQKSSGAEGDRLKEAANINKSLSTLGLVIMSLVDLAHGKHRHIPYRDSRLTFLLQDSLGGNSKTTIIANVSPSTCSANETLSTLKFAQRAKLIQNNAKVNEDASGDVNALQRQIQLLKGQLSSLMKRHNFSRSLSSCAPNFEVCLSSERYGSLGERAATDKLEIPSIEDKKMKLVEVTLVGSLRREKMAEVTLQKLQAEITHMNCLAGQREEDAQRIKMLLSFREEKIKQLELLVNGSLSAEKYLMEENKAFKEEIHLLQARIDRNPELTRFALENIRLLEQLQLFQNFYEQGERETLLAEVSELQDQLLEVLEGTHKFSSSYENQDSDIMKDLEDCRNMNFKLMREVNDLRTELRKYLNCNNLGLVMKDSENINKKALQAKLDKLMKDLEEARLLNCKYQEDQSSQLSHWQEVDMVREEVEVETTRTILHLQDEVTALQLELDKKLCCVNEENVRLRSTIAAQDERTRAICEEWERETLELTTFLLDGSRSLKDASGQIESIASSFPQVNVWINDHVERAARVCIEKDETILLLQKSLEDTQKMVVELEMKLCSLKGATMALNEFQMAENAGSPEEAVQLSMLLNEKIDTVYSLESKLRTKENKLADAERRADAAVLVVKWLSNCQKVAQRNDLEMFIAALQTDSLKAASACRALVQDLVIEIHELRIKFRELKEDKKNTQFCRVKLQSREAHNTVKSETRCSVLHQIKDELAETNDRLNIIRDSINTRVGLFFFPSKDEDLPDTDGSSAACSISGSDFSLQSFASGNSLDELACSSRCSGSIAEQTVDLKFGGLVLEANNQEPKKLNKLLGKPIYDEATLVGLRNELEAAYNSFHKLYVWLTTLLNRNVLGDSSYREGMNLVDPSFGSMMEKDGAVCHITREAIASKKNAHASRFFEKFEDTHAIMKEADLMLDALTKANENAKQLNSIWGKAGEELLVERASLMEEVELLKSSLSLKEGENKLLREHVHCSLVDIVNSISLFEGCFLQVQREVEDRFKVLYSDVLSMQQEMLNFSCNSRSSLKDIWSDLVENQFALFVQYLCHAGAFIRTIPYFNIKSDCHLFRKQESQCPMNNSQKICSSGQKDIIVTYKKGVKEGKQIESCEDLLLENLSLKKELERKEVLLQGLLFDLSLLQESASNKKDIKDETGKLILVLSQIQHELEKKTTQVDDLLVQHKKLESHLTDTENALFISNSDLEQARETIDTLIDQNIEFKLLIKDLYFRQSESEEQLDGQKEVVKGLEKENFHLTSSVEKNIISSVEGIEEDLRKVVSERDQLHSEVRTLNDKLEMACALADENEAIAVEARQESEASKIYAEQKGEEVKILEHSVEELESTINVLEKKVYEMDEEVERHRLIRESLELEIHALRHRLSTVENLTGIMDTENRNGEQADQLSRQLHNKLLELHEAHNRIRFLEKERSEQNKEIKQCKEYISELVLHSEAQALQYQQKYKALEAMVREAKTDLSDSLSTATMFDKSEKISTRTRGSSSPFRCISNLVQQMSVEKDQELSMARLQIEELESLAAGLQKEVCMLNTRLAAAESMTHDVIRDLLGVKLDLTNYANLIDQHQVQKLVDEAHQQAEDFLAKEHEVLNLRKQIDDLIQERERQEMTKKETDILAAEMTVQQLQERDQMLFAQNEMLKMDKTNLLRRVAELDEMVKTLLGTQSNERRNRQASNSKASENGLSKVGDADFTCRSLAHSEKLLSRVNDELAQYRKHSGTRPHDKSNRHELETKYRKQKA
ncbi:Kinesin domain-containing protein/Kinesin-relat_1 domain-containing protein [Cephalotus follicularis]|uniref:Kinesin domain-containing protein/Kinesin-relat_1 domain-containing protein n=1 Tax=Cephalotus follicularis TaxID=3775 RepID=A0A1Q3BUG4_CEPFO|nr:Kinesin domain-containing protein/Kinesin-relat_1 domain-containing protein [Cephalotus follicularis]